MHEPSLSIVEVAVPLPLDRTFSYLVPERFRDCVAIGSRVLVPFGKRMLTGYVLGPAASSEDLKEIVDCLDRTPLLTPRELEFLRWSASYYLHPLGEVLKAALPAGINITSRKKMVAAADGTLVAAEVLTGGRNVRTEEFYAVLPETAVPAGMR